MFNTISTCESSLQNVPPNINKESLNNLDLETKQLASVIEEHEKNIFFTNKHTGEIIIGKIPNINYIKPEHFNTFQDFISFSKSSDFIKTKDNFIKTINKFRDLCLLFMSFNDKDDFKNEISLLKNKIKDTQLYKPQGNSILTLFRDVRPKMFFINKTLNTILNEYRLEKINTQYTEESQGSIHFKQIKNLIYENIVANMGASPAEIFTRISLLEGDLLAFCEGSDRLIYQTKLELCNSFAHDFDMKLINRGEIANIEVTQVHRINALKNVVADQIAINKVRYQYSNSIKLTKENISEFIKGIKIKVSPINMNRNLATKSFQLFYNLIQIYKCTSILTDKGLLKNEIPDGFLDHLEHLIINFNKLYGNDENNIKTEDIVTYVYNKNDDTTYLKIANLEDKLSFYIARSLLPKNTHRVLADITDHSITDDSSLTIVSIANCYFGIVEKNTIELNQQHNIFADINQHANLQLKHITANLIVDNKLPRETYQALIIQALNQTNDPKQIIVFFMNPEIKQLLQENGNSDFILYLSSLITNKIEANEILKEQLIESICNEPSIITSHNNVNIDNIYWFMKTKLVEPVLLKLAEKNIDISNYINELTIDDILTLEHKNSLKKLCDASIKPITNKEFFYQLFYKLMEHAESDAIITLVHSGLINHLFNNKYDNLLLILANKKDFSGIKLILDINRKLANEDKFNLNATDDNNNTLLMHIAEMGDASLLEDLISQGVSCVDQQNNQGETALMLVATNGNIQCLDTLIQNNAKVNTQNNQGWTALIYAACNGYDNSVTMLVENNANIDEQKRGGWTALLLATYYGHDKCVTKLVEYNANINKQKKDRETALMLAVRNGNEKYLNMFLAAGADKNIQNHQGCTALMLAARYGQDKCLSTLIENSTVIDKPDNNTWTAVMHAASRGHDECLSILVANKAKINQQKQDGATALMLAAGHGHYKCMSILIANGATINIQDNKKTTVFMYAISNNHDECARKLIENGAKINQPGLDGFTLLMLAAINRSDACLKLLIEKGVDINQRDGHKWTALMYAACYGAHKCLKILIEHGAERDAINANKQTALILAQEQNQIKCMKILTGDSAT